jgi:hypothetical protein
MGSVAIEIAYVQSGSKAHRRRNHSPQPEQCQLGRRTPARTLVTERHDSALPREGWDVSLAEGHQFHLQLSRLGVDVQTRGCRVIRHRCTAGSSAGVALHTPESRPAGPDCDRGGQPREEEADGTRRRESPRERRPVCDVRDRDGDGNTAEARRRSTVAINPPTAGNANPSSKPVSVSGAPKLREPASTRRDGTQRRTSAKRRAISDRMRELWATRRGREKNQKASGS